MTTSTSTAVYAELRAARDLLLRLREDYPAAREHFRWPRPAHLNWARDWLDHLAADPVEGARPALWLVDEDGTQTRLTYAEIAHRSARLAAWLQGHGVSAGERVLVMLGNQVELWETVVACIRLGAVVIPASTLLSPADVRDRLARGGVRHVVARSADTATFAGLHGGWTPICVGAPVRGWLDYAEASRLTRWQTPDTDTRAGDTLLLYFTSGTTALPKLVEHTHSSYPLGHLSTMYWIGLQPGDVHLNISSPGWAKHAWSNLFAPWLAGACALVVNQSRFAAEPLLETMARCGVTTFCAPPTVWRMLVQADLAAWRGRIGLRETVGAGEPLNPEVIEQVQRAWGLTVRDGFGQTETTALVGNAPGQKVVPGSMGRPLPGYDVVLADPVTGQVRTDGGEGEICLRLDPDDLGRPLGLMVGYKDDAQRTEEAMRDGLYHTGDVATCDADGYITYVGRADDVFKASDYRISPFELESVLIEHPAVAEAAVVPSPDPVRLAVPKAFVVLAAGWEPDAATATAILRYCREQLAPYKRIRRIEFAELPKTISGKIRRVELRGRESDRPVVVAVHGDDAAATTARALAEFWEEDLPGLRDPAS
jgi:acetyl-CoA synthetase